MFGLNFLTQAHHLNTAHITYYDNMMVVLSYLIACLAAYTAWSVTALYRIEKQPLKKLSWLCCGGLVMGCGIWAMHFVAMLAYRLPISVQYDLTMTMLSVLPAIVASTLAIAIIAKQTLGAVHYIYGSIAFGAGITTMHYSGMAAMRMNASMVYDPAIFALSILLAVLLSFIALRLKSITEQFSSHQYYLSIKNGSILMMGAAITGMHYTGMAAVYIFPMAHNNPQPIASDHHILPVIVICLSILLMLFTVAIAIFESNLIKAIEAAQVNTQHMYEAIENVPEGVVLFDDNDKLILTNENFKKMYQEIGDWIKPGISYSELVEKQAQFAAGHTAHPPGEEPNQNSGEDYVSERLKWHQNPGKPFDETLTDGRHIQGKEAKAPSGDLVGIWTEIDDIEQAKERLVQTNKQVQMLLGASPSPIIVRTIKNNEVLYLNDSARDYFARKHFAITVGDTRTFINVEQIKDLKQHVLDQSNLTNVEYQLTSDDGVSYTVIMSATLISFDEKPSILFSFIDISERIILEQQVSQLTHTDPLTDVYNRVHFIRIGAREIARSQRNKQPLSMLILTMEQYGQIFEHHGQVITDSVIVKFSDTCQFSVREVDIVGRVGDDTFAIMLPDTDIRFATLIAERITHELESHPLSANGQMLSVTIRFGSSIAHATESDDIEQMLERAAKPLGSG